MVAQHHQSLSAVKRRCNSKSQEQVCETQTQWISPGAIGLGVDLNVNRQA